MNKKEFLFCRHLSVSLVYVVTPVYGLVYATLVKRRTTSSLAATLHVGTGDLFALYSAFINEHAVLLSRLGDEGRVGSLSKN